MSDCTKTRDIIIKNQYLFGLQYLITLLSIKKHKYKELRHG